MMIETALQELNVIANLQDANTRQATTLVEMAGEVQHWQQRYANVSQLLQEALRTMPEPSRSHIAREFERLS